MRTPLERVLGAARGLSVGVLCAVCRGPMREIDGRGARRLTCSSTCRRERSRQRERARIAHEAAEAVMRQQWAEVDDMRRALLVLRAGLDDLLGQVERLRRA